MLPLVAEISTPVLLDNVGVPAAVVANDPAVTTSVDALYVNPASPPNAPLLLYWTCVSAPPGEPLPAAEFTQAVPLYVKTSVFDSPFHYNDQG